MSRGSSTVITEHKDRRVMAQANFSGDLTQKTFRQQLCRAGLTAAAETHGQLIFLSGLNIFLSVTAVLGNALILVALRKASCLHPRSSKILLRSLAVSDLCVGLISEPLTVTYWMSELNGYWNICRYVWAAGYVASITLCVVSLLTLTAISVERLLVLLGLRYRQVVTLKLTYTIVITLWVVSTAITTMYFWNFLIALWYAFAVVLLCLVTSIFAYTKIFFSLRRYQVQLQSQTQRNSQENPINIARHKKAVSSALWLQLSLIACYLPHGILTTLWTNNELFSSVFLASKYTVTSVFLNSSLNPILYCWKIEEVRQAVKDTIRQMLCCSSY